jgi:hypothetical protein
VELYLHPLHVFMVRCLDIGDILSFLHYIRGRVSRVSPANTLKKIKSLLCYFRGSVVLSS